MDVKLVDNYIESNKDRFLDELIDLLKVPSVNAAPSFSKDVQKAAELVNPPFQ